MAINLFWKNMKLAEALIIRADLQKRIAQLSERLKDSARVQEGDEPAESVEILREELEGVLSQVEDLIYRINVTNMQTVLEGETLTRMMAQKDVLAMRLNVLRSLIEHVTGGEARYGRNEIKFVRTVDVAELRRTVDAYSKQLRELDTKIQGLNWTTDLVEV